MVSVTDKYVTRLDGTTYEQTIIVGINCRSRVGVSANGNEEKHASNDE